MTIVSDPDVEGRDDMLTTLAAPDDNRFDLRPFLYPPFWKSWSFKRIDMELERIERKRAAKKA